MSRRMMRSNHVCSEADGLMPGSRHVRPGPGLDLKDVL